MSIIRLAERRRYAVIANDALNDPNLSFRARGILAWLLSKPDDWNVRREDIALAGKEGESAIRTALAELAEHGYLRRNRMRLPSGQIVTETVVYEAPPDVLSDAPEDENHPSVLRLPEDENQPPENQPPVNHPIRESTIPSTKTVISLLSCSDDPPTMEALRLGRAGYPVEFEEAWRAYPRKSGKRPAYGAWRARVMDAKKMGIPRERRINAMTTAAINYAAAMADENREQQHIKQAATFYGPSEPWKEYVKVRPVADEPPDEPWSSSRAMNG